MRKRLTKLVSIGLAACIMIGLAACGSSAPAASAPAASEPAAESAPVENADAAGEAEAAASIEGASGKPYRIGLSMGSMQTDFTVKLAEEVQAAVDADENVELTTISADNDPNMQATNIDNFVTMGVDAILVYPVEPEVCADAMKRARDAGIYVVIIDQIPEDTDSFDIGISVSMHDLGVGVCELASDWIDATFPDAGEGTVKAATLGLWSTEQFAERCEVFNDIASYNPKAVLVESYDVGIANFMTETAQDVEILLQKHPDINVIMCFTDAQAIIAEEAIEKNKDAYQLDTSKIGVFTVDHSEASYDLLGKSATGDSCLLGIATTNLAAGKLMYNCAMKNIDISNLVDGKILYQEVSKITAENMEDYREYIISAN